MDRGSDALQDKYLHERVTVSVPVAQVLGFSEGHRYDLAAHMALRLHVPEPEPTWSTDRLLIRLCEKSDQFAGEDVELAANSEPIVRLAVHQLLKDPITKPFFAESVVADFRWDTVGFNTTVGTYEQDVIALMHRKLTRQMKPFLDKVERARRGDTR